ncbi:helicase/secretion neighborhood CpaE-like protein [Thermomonospora echinospora]|uniref:Helicase/secretion neighborhood CpaE-like protein n=1 Tax=Thermomonospora echinospora TaxID=1992 RepID=A0A1H6CET0_9ACTN|nr:septum site-determining protein Ssd [Thermomonospora echinospora]SEG71519.1 helicase/secretion neighborhood CpaE-like protein [Thermomonospora echinospora]
MAIDALIATGDPRIADDLLRLAAAANADAALASTAEQARTQWRRPPLVLVGADMADGLAADGVARRTGVVLVTTEADAPDGFRAAVEVGAQDLATLPADEPWLVDALAAAAEPCDGRATTVCVVGGRGGAGASVLAAMLGLAGARGGLRTLLVDGDPMGGGVDLLLGQENAPGCRWPDLAGRRGRLGAGLLRESLPAVDGLVMLSWHRGDADPLTAETMHTVLDAASRGFDLIIVDLSREPGAAGRAALRVADRTLMIVPAELRATAAADRVAVSLQRDTDDIRLIVRGPAPGGLPAEAMAEALGLPLAGTVQEDRRLPSALERGDLVRLSRRGSLPDLCDRLIGDLRPRPAALEAEAA